MTERFTVHFNDLLRYTSAKRLVSTVPENEQLRSVVKDIGRCAVANGCFDGCHPGHLEIFAHLDTEAYARRLRPIVAINSDSSVRGLKGPGRPLIPQEARATLINNLRWPLTVVIFDEGSVQNLMDFLQPVVVIKGQEYDPKTVVRWKDSEVLRIPMKDSWSTTSLLGNTR
jgi:D-beta-D-heptose 7-phosphate kinase / D-beta-D-heptose 1-phosphate adenosyltransferase